MKNNSTSLPSKTKFLVTQTIIVDGHCSVTLSNGKQMGQVLIMDEGDYNLGVSSCKQALSLLQGVVVCRNFVIALLLPEA